MSDGTGPGSVPNGLGFRVWPSEALASNMINMIEAMRGGPLRGPRGITLRIPTLYLSWKMRGLPCKAEGLGSKGHGSGVWLSTNGGFRIWGILRSPWSLSSLSLC